MGKARPCSEENCSGYVWKGSEDLCLLHDESPYAQEKKSHGRSLGGSRSPRNDSPAEPPFPAPQTAGEVRRYLSWATAELIGGRMSEKAYNELRKGMDTTLKALQEEKKEAKLEAKIRDLQKKIRKLQEHR